METTAPPAPPKPSNPFDRLSPTTRALIVFVLITLVNLGVGYIWPKDGTAPPTLPVPQSPAIVQVFTTAAPASPAPIQVAGK